MSSSEESSGENTGENTEGREFGGGLFDTFRTLPFPTLYGPMKSPVTVDVLEVGLLFAIVILGLSFLIVLPGIIFKKRLIFFLKIVLGCFILVSIFISNFGQEWEVAEANAVTQYKAGTRKHIHAEIGVKIGLRSVNITLKAHDDDSDTVDFGNHNETINYNERFAWDNPGWTQGRAGFGPFAGRINQEFRAGQLRGMPYPILWIAEYFVPDGEGIRWGRYYRQAGYYSHILLWLAFPLYILSVILIMMVRSYGAMFFILTGLSMIGANMCFGLIRNPTQLLIPFEPEKLVFHWGWCFWLCLFTGLLNIILGITAAVLDFVAPDWLCDFLNIDVTKDYEEFYLSQEELENLGIVVPGDGKKKDRYSKANGSAQQDTDGQMHHVYRKRMTGLEERLGTTRFGKQRTMSRYRVMNRGNNDDDDIRDAAMGRMEKERPPMPRYEKNEDRKPVIPQNGANGRDVYYENPAMDRDSAFSYDQMVDDYQDVVPPSHGLNMDAKKPAMDNYDNARGPQPHQHFRSRRASDDPIYDSMAAPFTPTRPIIEEEEEQGEQAVYDNLKGNHITANNNLVTPPPLPPCLLKKDKVNGSGNHVSFAQNDEPEARGDSIRLTDIRPNYRNSTSM